MDHTIRQIAHLFGVENCTIRQIPGHEGGRNQVFVVEDRGEKKYVLRLSSLNDRTEEDYLAETEFVHYLAQGGASVADVLPSVNGTFVERIEGGSGVLYASLFAYAPGMLIADNGYRYREGAPLSEYFFNTGKTLGKIHALSKTYVPVHRRKEYADKYSKAYIGQLIPDVYQELKEAIYARLDAFEALPADRRSYGLLHFDFSDGNYHVDMKTGALTVFDFDNSLYGWYMFDLANLWTHGVGWCRFERDPQKRRAFMDSYFQELLSGYRTETELPGELENQLTLFIDMVLIENIADEFECCLREGEEVEYGDIEEAAESLIHNVPWAGFFEE